MPQPDPVVIAGGGWAGLAAAVDLSNRRIPVILLEPARQAGGRARSVNVNGLQVDNGQHLLLGAYASTLHILHTLGVREDAVLLRQPLQMHWLRDAGSPVHLRAPRLPAPLHLAWGLLWSRGLSLRERLSALAFSRALQRRGFQLQEDVSLSALLQAHGQSPRLIAALWEPLCLSALNTHVHEASAQIFLRTLGDAFRHARRDSDLLLPRQNLGAILPGPALEFIAAHGGEVRLGRRLTGLVIRDGAITGVKSGDEELHCAHVILATPHAITRRLLQAHAELRPLSEQLGHLQDRPICTVYLQYPPQVHLPHPMQGSLNTVSQWIFDRSLHGQHGLIAVVISADGDHMRLDAETLGDTVVRELAALFPHWPAPLSRHVIREKRATFASRVHVNRHRPDARTPVTGLWLAGDYTAVGLPATLEGAIRSGLHAARQILREQRHIASTDTAHHA